jgi:hypothetical protein
MTTAATIQARVYRGYGIAARVIGDTYKFYRPGNPPPPIDQTDFDVDGATWDSPGINWDQIGNLLFELPVSLNAEDMNYSRPNKYGKATWYALVDGTDLEVGDYFIGPQGIFFIAALQPLLPIFVVECNRVVSIYRPQAQNAFGLGGYGGNTAANETLLVAGRPCSILQGTKGEKSDGNLPSDTRSPWWQILLPYAGVDLTYDDIIVDDLGRRYVISSPELSDLGWRLTGMPVVP